MGGVNLTSSKSINVINQSWSYIYLANDWNCNNGCGIAPSDAVYNAGIANKSTEHSNLIKFFSGVTSVANISNISNAVITQAAGNDKLDSKYTLTALALAENSIVKQRLLVVGALDKNGTTSNKATIASYSNYAGSNVAISDRFVTANGTMPWSAGSVKINGSNFGVRSGTSYAAPLVAGYAAILMHKFPNLDAVKTSSIILDTARYDTLTCHPNCDPTIYGKGEASLSRALAPVGRLR
jgi:subtilisin family serine protease